MVTGYFWWSNIKGIHESSGKALRIMQITTVMVVIFLIWCPLTLLVRGNAAAAARAHACRICISAHEALGWLARDLLAADSAGADHRRLRPLPARDERL